VFVSNGITDVDGDDVVTVNEKKRKCNGGTTSGPRCKKQKMDLSANLLDATWIHPESYDLAERYI
jgi:hypothetical protein